MVRFVVSSVVYLLLYTACARWIYCEVELVAPILTPVFDSVVKATSIPTHDKWSHDSFSEILKGVEQITLNFTKQDEKENDSEIVAATPSSLERLVRALDREQNAT